MITTNILILLLVGISGGLGTVLRVLILEKTPGFRTLLKINIASSFLITLTNLVLHLSDNQVVVNALNAILGAGLFGGFSSLSALVVTCIKEKQFLKKNLITIFCTVFATFMAACAVSFMSLF
ncbi:MAG: hypothetical protein LBI63_02635 [Candidatus Ancillula sp.]|jgi:fluoride ion exporter CrcB/FEX|nr:hypothetical protein [Candidatus Ancillula sp.]